MKANEFKMESGVCGIQVKRIMRLFPARMEKMNVRRLVLCFNLGGMLIPRSISSYIPKWKKYEKLGEVYISDLSPLFFSGKSFNKEPAFNEIKYTTSNKANIITIRFANSVASSGKQYSIDWGSLNDQIFISNDKDCLRQELDKNADAYEP